MEQRVAALDRSSSVEPAWLHQTVRLADRLSYNQGLIQCRRVDLRPNRHTRRKRQAWDRPLLVLGCFQQIDVPESGLQNEKHLVELMLQLRPEAFPTYSGVQRNRTNGMNCSSVHN